MRILKGSSDYPAVWDSEWLPLLRHIEFAVGAVPFYRQKLQKTNWRTTPFFDLPITTEQDLQSSPLAFVPDDSPVLGVTSSGGTTSEIKLIFRTALDLDRSVRATVQMFRRCGITARDRVMILQPFDMWNIGHIAMRALQAMNCLCVPTGLSGTDEICLRLLAAVGCNVLYCTPTHACRLASLLSSEGSRTHVKSILCAGEPITPQQRETVRRAFGAEIYGIYGSEETDGIGTECNLHNGYHVADDDFVLEILNPATMRPAESGEGALAVTRCGTDGTTLVRYLLGDVVRCDTSRCECGESSLRMKVVGRIKETVWLYDGIRLPLAAVESALQRAVGHVPHHQIAVDTVEEIETVLISVDASSTGATAHELLRELSQSTPDLATAFRTSIDADADAASCISIDGRIRLMVSLGDTESFHSTARGKVPRVVDRRAQCV